MVDKPTDISGFLIHYVYIKNASMEEIFTNIIVENIYFSNNDAVRISIEKNYVDFHINP